MRSASSYRAARKKDAKAVGMSLPRYNRVFDVAARAAERVPPEEAQEAARKKLALWAANGGRETAISQPISDERLKRMNEGALSEDLRAVSGHLQPASDDGWKPVARPVSVEQAAEAAKKLTVEDVDKALEAALSNWHREGHEDPLPLGKLFAARARQLGWVEDVEFVEEK